MAEQIERLVTVWDARFDRLEEKLNKAVRATYGAASKMEKRLDAVNDNVASKFKRNLGSEFSRGLDELGSNAGRASGLLSGLGAAGVVAAAGLGAVVAALAQAKAAVAFGDAIADSAQKIGVSTDTLQEYRYAIHQLGGEYTDADAALSKFTQTLGKAQTIGGKSLKAFKALEIDPQQFHDTDEALRAVLDKLSRIQDESKRQGLAAALGLEQFIPLAREGTTKLDELREAARNLGFVMDKDLIARAGEVNDKLEDLQQVVSVQLASAFIELAPYILKVAEAMVKGAQFAHDFAATLQDVKNWADSLGLSPLFKWFDTLLDHVNPVTIALRNMQGALQAIQGNKNPLQESIKSFAKTGKVSDDMSAVRAFYAPKPAPFDPKAPSSGGGGAKASKAPKDRSDQLAAQIEDQFRQTQRDLLTAWRDQLTGEDQRADLANQLLDLDKEAFNAKLDQQEKDIRATEGLSKAKQDELITALERVRVEQGKVDELRREGNAREATAKKAQDALAVRQSEFDVQEDALRLAAQMARTAAERRDIELKLLDVSDQRLKAELEAVIASKTARDADKQIARNKLAQLDASRGAREQGVINNTRGPLEDYFASLPQTADEVNEAFQDLYANGVDTLINGLAEAGAGMRSFKSVIVQTIQQMAVEANRVLLRNLFSGLAGGAGGLFGGFNLGSFLGAGGFNAGGIDISGLAGLYAHGTNSARGGLSLVGERGPELLNIPRGSQVIPNDILRTMARSRATSINNSRTSSTVFNISVTGGGSPAQNRETGAQIAAEASRRMAMYRRRGY